MSQVAVERTPEDQALIAKIEAAISAENAETNKLATAAAQVEPLQEVGLTSEDIIQGCRQELDFLAMVVMPTVVKFGFPPIFIEVWKWLVSQADLQQAFPQLALGLPRGFAKTTLMKLFIAYCVLLTNKKFILIVGAKASLAENILADVMDMISEPNVVAAFGDWKLGVEKDTQDQKKFGFRGRNIILAAIGSESKVRGLNMKNSRPDVMLFDDLQSREVADSEILSEKLLDWMIGTCMKAKSQSGCMYLFVANMYPTKHSILRKLKNNPMWDSFITGGIQADGTSLWEDLQPIAQLLQEFKNDLAMGKPQIFYAEVLNDENISYNTRVDLSKLPECPYQEGDIAAGKFIVIDPSTEKKDADDVSIGYFEVHNTHPVLMELECGVMSPANTIRAATKMAIAHNCTFIVVEANAYQHTLIGWFDFIFEQLGIQGIEVAPIYSGVKSKIARIIKMFTSLTAGELFIYGDCTLAAHLQISEFNALKTDNVDGILDLLTYAGRVKTEFPYEIQQQLLDMEEDEEDYEVDEFNSCF